MVLCRILVSGSHGAISNAKPLYHERKETVKHAVLALIGTGLIFRANVI